MYEVLVDREDVSHEEWVRIRRQGGVGASESPILLGANKYTSPRMLYAYKIGALEPGEQNEAMWWGNELEPNVLKGFVRETGREAELWQRTLRSTKYPFLTCTPDAIYTGKYEGGHIQIKVTSNASAWQEDVPTGVWVQVQHEMAVTGHEFVTVAALVGGTRLVWKDVPRDEEFIQKQLVPVCRDFWRCVETKTPYAITSTQQNALNYTAERKAFVALHPNDNGESVQLGGEYVEKYARRAALIEQKKEIEKEIAALELDFQQAIGDNTYGLLSNGARASLKTTAVPAKTIERKAYSFRALRFTKPKEQ